MNNSSRNIVLWILAGLMLVLLFNLFQSPAHHTAYEELSYDQFVSRIQTGAVKSVDIHGDVVKGALSDGRHFTTRLLKWDPEISRILREAGIQINVKGDDKV